MCQNRKNKRTIGTMVLMIAAAFLAVGAMAPLFGASALAAPCQQGMGMEKEKQHRSALGIWKDQQLVQKLGLTKGQVKQLRNADFASREKPLELRAELEKLHLKMDKAFSEDTVNQKAVIQLAEKIANIKGQLFVRRIESRLSLNTILNTEQLNTLKQISMRPQNDTPPRAGRKAMPKRRGASKRQGPPPEAYSACEGKAPGESVEFRSPRGDMVSGICEEQGDRLMFRPDAPPEGMEPRGQRN